MRLPAAFVVLSKRLRPDSGQSFVVLFLFAFLTSATAQTQSPPSVCPEISWRHLLPSVLEDQKQMWWAFPNELAHGKHWLPTSAVVAGTAGLILLDPHDDPYFRRTTTFHHFNNVMSFNGTIAAMAAVPAATYIFGLVKHNSYAEQTTELAAEAVIDAGIPALISRDVARRIPPSDIPPMGTFRIHGSAVIEAPCISDRVVSHRATLSWHSPSRQSSRIGTTSIAGSAGSRTLPQEQSRFHESRSRPTSRLTFFPVRSLATRPPNSSSYGDPSFLVFLR
jgi:hypothetical protein